MVERWRDIKGYEGYYKISSYGRVFSVRNNIILKPYKKGNGYYGVKLQKQGKHQDKKLHRLVAEHFLDNFNNYDEVNHIDGNKTNNNVSNLEWCDRKYNCNYGDRNKKISDYQKLRWKISKIKSLILKVKDNDIKLENAYADIEELVFKE